MYKSIKSDTFSGKFTAGVTVYSAIVDEMRHAEYPRNSAVFQRVETFLPDLGKLCGFRACEEKFFHRAFGNDLRPSA